MRLALAILMLSLVACERPMNIPSKATRAYPFELHTTNTVDIQVFRRDTNLILVNSTARSYDSFDLWINQRYVRHVESLAAGQTLQLSLWDFHDVRGDAFRAGGFWRSMEPMPVRLVQAQPDPDAPMVGLITIRAEEIN